MSSINKEEWRDIRGYEGLYQVAERELETRHIKADKGERKHANGYTFSYADGKGGELLNG